ncbi:17625_t:CDS:1 [Acaulospora colombiana]|uniref:17625_t:CDS:1 n=1 Tax=Acaulospora colombiana TaxID=27376 RepID=A0ACA9JZN8_9GLOM|nr:17625_t:CDS:1 [Acaulospora colombiana]
MEAYRFYSYEMKPSSHFRGLICDKYGCGSDIIISSDGSTVFHVGLQTVRINFLMSTGVHKLCIKVENLREDGVEWFCLCGKFLDYSIFIGFQKNGWAISSNGSSYHNNVFKKSNTPRFRYLGAEVIMCLNTRTFDFSVDGKWYNVEWDDLPSELYFAASLGKGGKYTIKYRELIS